MADMAESSTISYEKKVVLFGKTGGGKSTIANALVAGGLMPVIFPYSDAMQGCTQEPMQKSGRTWTVLDTVGLGAATSIKDVGSADDKPIKDVGSPDIKPEVQLKTYLKGLKGEYSHIIYVMKGDRITTTDKFVWFLFTEIFQGGEDAFVILFTKASERWLEAYRSEIPEEMKKVRNICTVDIPPVHENEKLESVNVEVRQEQIEKLKETLEGFFRQRNYKYVLPLISTEDDDDLEKITKSIIARIKEKLMSLVTKENLMEVLRLLSSVVNIAAAILVAMADM